MDRETRFVGGLAGVGVGAFILTFASINEAIGGLFSREALFGQSIDPWLERIAANPTLAQVALLCPIVGFTLMLVVARVLDRALPPSGLKSAALAGYFVGVSLAVVNFTSALGLVLSLLRRGATAGELPEAAKVLIGTELSGFMLTNVVVGPLLIGVLGNAMMCLAGLRSRLMPRWLGIWGLGAAALLVVASLGSLWPPLLAASIGGPLTMLWFVAVGVVLLRGGFDQPTS